MAKTSVKQGKVLAIRNKGREPMENPLYAAVRLELNSEVVAALGAIKAAQPDIFNFTIPDNGEVCALPTIHQLAVMLQRTKEQPEDMLTPVWWRDMID